MAGGSEFRCVELANGIAKYTNHNPYLLSERKLPKKIKESIDPSVVIAEYCFESPGYFYNTDYLIIINSDSKEFSTTDYWLGKTPRQNIPIDLNRLKGKTICFLYNFIVSPSINLKQFEDYDINIKIITTNNKFYDEITKQDRYKEVKILPRYILTSPINPEKLTTFVRKPKNKICFGMHSKRLGNKWNDDFYKLIKDINDKNKVDFRFMGVKSDLMKKISEFDNVTAMKEDEETVKEFLNKIDIFLFFPEWKREEPWGRVIAEAMVSGCPVIALNKGGTPDQVLHWNNGILCKTYNDYYRAITYFIRNKEVIPLMSRNSIKISKSFYSETVINKLMFILNN